MHVPQPPQFQAKFTIEKVEGKGEQEVNLITCEGIGFLNKRIL